MSMITQDPKFRENVMRRREALTQRFPKFAALMKPSWDRMDQKYGLKTASQQAGAQPAAVTAPLAASVTANPGMPQREVTSKMLLGN